jgi:hypothetical protein
MFDFPLKLQVSNPGYLATEIFNSSKIYEIPTEGSEERISANFTKIEK